MYPRIGKTLGGFHHKVDRWLAGMQPSRDTEGRWVYPPLEELMMTVGLEEVETYVLHHQNTAAQYISTNLILELCLAEEQHPWVRVNWQWWEKAGLNFGQEAGREAEGTGGLEVDGDMEDGGYMVSGGRRVAAEYVIWSNDTEYGKSKDM